MASSIEATARLRITGRPICRLSPTRVNCPVSRETSEHPDSTETAIGAMARLGDRVAQILGWVADVLQ